MAVARIHVGGRLKPDSTIALEEQQAHYLLKVLRLKNHSTLRAFDDMGAEYSAQLQIKSKSRHQRQSQHQLRIQQPLSNNCESHLNIHLGQVISRGKRMDYTVQKATELGVTQITPLVSRHCAVKLRAEKSEETTRLRHWQEISRNAAQQSLRTVIPKINPVQSLERFLNTATGDLKIALHQQANARLSSLAALQPTNVLVLIGAEGGFDADEIKQAQQHGFYTLLLGPRVLRTETAAPVALGLLQYLYGDM